MPEKLNLMQHVRFLAGEIGPRPAGTPAHAAATDYVKQTLRRTGLAMEHLPFTVPGWSCDATTLTLNGESGESNNLHAAANLVSPPCDVTAPLVTAGTVADLDALAKSGDLAGKIAVLYDDLTRYPLIPLNCPIYNDPRDQHINRTLLEANPAAVITVNPHLNNVERRIEDADFTIPSATVPADVGARLLHHAVNHANEPVHLRIVAQDITQTAPVAAHHILGLQPGSHPARIALMAHFDTKLDTPGAWDNAGGIAALLGLAERLAGRDLGCGLEFIAFADEENYSQDHVVYINERGPLFGDVIAAINMDGIAHILGQNTITCMAGNEAFQAALAGVTAHYPRVQWVDPWPQSNHSTFAFNGVPAVALCSSVGWDIVSLRHQPGDTPLWLSNDLLNEVVDLVVAIVETLADKSPDAFRVSTTPA
ncbi:MAG: M28 family peptidase [Anaerolineae bacterium]|nr:M28 family peptidase [Anaerolineae bacterium]